MATKQMVTMLIQKDYIKYGLKNKSFLMKTPVNAAKVPYNNNSFDDRTNTIKMVADETMMNDNKL